MLKTHVLLWTRNPKGLASLSRAHYPLCPPVLDLPTRLPIIQSKSLLSLSFHAIPCHDADAFFFFFLGGGATFLFAVPCLPPRLRNVRCSFGFSTAASLPLPAPCFTDAFVPVDGLFEDDGSAWADEAAPSPSSLGGTSAGDLVEAAPLGAGMLLGRPAFFFAASAALPSTRALGLSFKGDGGGEGLGADGFGGEGERFGGEAGF